MYGCGAASGSGWNLWVWLVCGCKEVYRFPQYYLSLLLLYLFFFAAASLLFVHFKNVFRVHVLFVIKFYVLNNFSAQYKHTYGRL